MHHSSFQAIQTLLCNPQQPTLWIADENALHHIAAVPPSPALQLLSNRFDVANIARHAGHRCLFNDFACGDFTPGSFQRVVFQVAKEKAVNHHLVNTAQWLLPVGGELVMSGQKQEGIKSLFEKSKSLLGSGSWEKHGASYLGTLTKQHTSNANPLDDQDYRTLRLTHTDALDFWSKPGLFGWNKIDEGSAFLIEHLPVFLASFAAAPSSMLDLGCGYGYLTLMSRELPLQQRFATDNNAAALLATQKNAEHYQMPVTVLAADGADSLQHTVDMILCNPPFHQGFSHDNALTAKFLQHAKRLLKPAGKALFVVNSFIGIETLAATLFARVECLANNRRFKLLALSP